ncbi:PP2C family protein-serine/threonine phosphatase [Hylemonella sp. W303a]|uniref:PP2C family protein-serine/threonine phosphatase n=1 Tax=Hylemonella sp. W303a TaxID=3389873 RepID=UPI00396B36EF
MSLLKKEAPTQGASPRSGLSGPEIAISCGMSHKGHVRQVNEDSYLDLPQKGLWVVADGMGGHEAGDVASQLIVNSLRQAPLNGSLSDRLNEIEDVLDRVNRSLLERGQGKAQAQSESAGARPPVIGSTIALLAAEDRHVGVVMWAGDSRVYRLRKGCSLEQVSSDHSQIATYLKQGLITPEEAKTHPERHIITRAVGSQEDLFLEADLCELASGERFLLCSDGLTRHLNDDEIAQLLAEGTPQEACQKLIDLTLSRGAKDNVTTLVVEIA